MAAFQGTALLERDIGQEIVERDRKLQAILNETEEDEVEVAASSVQPLTLGSWMLDIISNLTNNKSRPPERCST
jgi:hypothetical protein